MSNTLIETDTTADLWQRQAFADTVFLASQHGMPLSPDSELGLYHLGQMQIRARSMAGSKLGRWLGWAQCAVVAAGVGLTLDDMKAINQRCMTEWSGTKPEAPVGRACCRRRDVDNRCATTDSTDQMEPWRSS